MMQMRPEQPSLMTRSNVSCRRARASWGMWSSLFCSPSFTSSCRLLPKMLDSHILMGSCSKSYRRLITSSSLWRSEPTMGEISVLMVALSRWMEGALARRRTP